MDKRECDEFITAIFGLRDVLLKKFPGKSRRRWYDAEDAFSDVFTDLYAQVRTGKLGPAPNGWFAFIRREMRKKLWLARRRDRKIISADAASKALRSVVTDVRTSRKADDPTAALQVREELAALVPEVKEMLSPKQQSVFFSIAQELPSDEVARIAGTSAGSARVAGAKAEEKLKEWREGLAEEPAA